MADAVSAAPGTGATNIVAPGENGAPTYQWAPREDAPRKRHTGLWAGGISAVVIGGLVAASFVLIAPGAAIAGVPVGGLTPGAAADAVSARLAQTQLVLTGAGDDAIVTGADLGASVDAEALAALTHEQQPMWNPAAWFSGPTEATISIDETAAVEALRAAAPDLYTDPVSATLAFDAAAGSYVVTPAEEGTGIDLDAVTAALQDAFTSGSPTTDIPVSAVPVQATTPTYVAQGAADMLNGMIATAGFYVGSERTVPIDAATLTSWLTVEVDDRGAFQVSADAAAIQAVVSTLADKVDRKVKDTRVVSNSAGKVIKTIRKGVTGRTLGTTAGIATSFAAQLSGGDAVLVLPVTEEEPKVVEIERTIEVDLSAQRVYLRENGEVIKTFKASTGTSGHPTITGTYRIVGKLTTQNMGNPDLDKAPYYYTKNVPWVMYFNGDQALHGAYWHNNFGHRMSHGCVNLPVSAAKYAFEWAPVGTPVWVHH